MRPSRKTGPFYAKGYEERRKKLLDEERFTVQRERAARKRRVREMINALPSLDL